MPVNSDFRGQLSRRGLGRPNSLCKIPVNNVEIAFD